MERVHRSSRSAEAAASAGEGEGVEGAPAGSGRGVAGRPDAGFSAGFSPERRARAARCSAPRSTNWREKPCGIFQATASAGLTRRTTSAESESGGSGGSRSVTFTREKSAGKRPSAWTCTPPLKRALAASLRAAASPGPWTSTSRPAGGAGEGSGAGPDSGAERRMKPVEVSAAFGAAGRDSSSRTSESEAPKASMSGKRSSGLLESAFRMAASKRGWIEGFSLRGATGGSWRWARRSWVMLRPENGSRPVAISKAMTPRA